MKTTLQDAYQNVHPSGPSDRDYRATGKIISPPGIELSAIDIALSRGGATIRETIRVRFGNEFAPGRRT